MQPLSTHDIFHIWEAGRDKHPVDRALVVLARALPQMASADMSDLTIGQRNRHILALRRVTLGSEASCFAECPQCGAALEFTLDLATLDLPAPEQEAYVLTQDGWVIDFRLPTSRDLAAVAGIDDLALARQLLIERCITHATHNELAAGVDELPESVVLAMAEAMVTHDPQAELHFTLVCTDCAYNWTTLFDIISFFWTEIDSYARRLLREVHSLARAYGWREDDILALSPTRRHAYLDMIGK